MKPVISNRHTWGCPVFILTKEAQDNKSAKWEPRSRCGIYLGHSPTHAGNVAMVLNPKTLHVSPQFHVVFDDTFSTVDHMEKGTIPPNWQELVDASENLEPEGTTELEKIWSSQTMDEPIEESTSMENPTTSDEAPPTPTQTN